MKEIQLTQGKFALVDDDDFEKVNQFKWCAHKSKKCFYVVRYSNGKIEKLHRFILNIIDSKIQVDHKNVDGLDNRKSNLRICSASENQRNRNIQSNNTSGYKGVSFNKKHNKYEAYVCNKRKRIYLGLYFTAISAAIAYNKKALELHGEFARLNIIPEVSNE